MNLWADSASSSDHGPPPGPRAYSANSCRDLFGPRTHRSLLHQLGIADLLVAVRASLSNYGVGSLVAVVEPVGPAMGTLVAGMEGYEHALHASAIFGAVRHVVRPTRQAWR